MKIEDIIEHKIKFLSGNATADISPEMQSFVDSNSELQQELTFIESFWSNNKVHADKQPSAAMDARFYQMLSKAQSAAASTPKLAPSPSMIENIVNWFAPKYLIQLAAAAAIFTVGFQMNSSPAGIPKENVASLQTEVKSLSTLVALSMLQNNSASERLSGVSYVVNSDQSNPVLSAKLIDMLNNDDSTAVKLSVINALANRSSIKAIEQDLLSSVTTQEHALVQIKLIDVLLSKGNPDIHQSINQMAEDGTLSGDVVEHIQQWTKTQFI